MKNRSCLATTWLGLARNSQNCNGNTISIDWPHLCMEVDDGGHDHNHRLHGVANAE